MRHRQREKRTGTQESAWFVLIAFGLPLVCVVLMKSVPICRAGWFNFVLYGIQSASPAIAVLAVTLWARGPRGLQDFLREKYTKHSVWKLAGAAFLIPMVLLTFARLTTWAAGYGSVFLSIPNGKKLMILAWALLAEELGWRGFLQENVEQRANAVCTPLIVGGIWWLWHYHFFLSGAMAVPPLALGAGCIVESYGYYAITKWAKGKCDSGECMAFFRQFVF